MSLLLCTENRLFSSKRWSKPSLRLPSAISCFNFNRNLLSPCSFRGRITHLLVLCAVKEILPFNFFSYAYRFRSGFKLAFRWCPCIKATEKDKLKLTSPSLYQSTRRKSRKSSFNTETHFNEEEKTSFTPTQQMLWFLLLVLTIEITERFGSEGTLKTI